MKSLNPVCHMRSIAVAALLFVPIACLDAAEEFQDSIPLEVAEALFGFGSGGNMNVYSDIMDEFPEFELPGRFEVLGSSERAMGSLTLALVTALNEEDARESLVESFADEGWIEMPNFGMPSMETGFVSANQPVRPSYRQLCHDEYGQMNISYSDRGGRNFVTASTGAAFGGDYRTCSERIEEQEMSMARFSQRNQGIREYMPLLLVPEDARQGRVAFLRGGGMSSSGNSAETDTNFSIEWELAEVFEHFAQQIVEQGWTLDAESLGSITAAGTWTQPSEGGANLVVRLDVVKSNEDRYDLTLRVEGPGGRRGGGVFYGN